jgi:hypothetical protein
MVEEYISNPRDDVEERFAKLESQISNISCNMVILMATLESMFTPLGSLAALTKMLALRGNMKTKKNLRRS